MVPGAVRFRDPRRLESVRAMVTNRLITAGQVRFLSLRRFAVRGETGQTAVFNPLLRAPDVVAGNPRGTAGRIGGDEPVRFRASNQSRADHPGRGGNPGGHPRGRPVPKRRGQPVDRASTTESSQPLPNRPSHTRRHPEPAPRRWHPQSCAAQVASATCAAQVARGRRTARERAPGTPFPAEGCSAGTLAGGRPVDRSSKAADAGRAPVSNGCRCGFDSRRSSKIHDS